MKNKKFYKTLPIVAILLAFFSCTDLEEEILDESLTGTGQAEIVSGSIAPAYGLLSQVWLHTANFGHRYRSFLSNCPRIYQIVFDRSF